ncbi:MAG: uL22 family ribosomal protein, partial [Bacteroidales bacterium]
ALDIFYFSTLESDTRWCMLVGSDIANWEAKNEADRKQLDNGNVIIETIMVDEGRTLKRIHTAPQGRAARIRKRSNHVTIILGIKPEKKAEPAKETEKPATEVAAKVKEN